MCFTFTLLRECYLNNGTLLTPMTAIKKMLKTEGVKNKLLYPYTKNTHWWLLTFCCWSTHLPTISVRTSSRQDHLKSSTKQADQILTQRVAINNNHKNTHLCPIFLTGTPSPSHERRKWRIRCKKLTHSLRNEPTTKPTTCSLRNSSETTVGQINKVTAEAECSCLNKRGAPLFCVFSYPRRKAAAYTKYPLDPGEPPSFIWTINSRRQYRKKRKKKGEKQWVNCNSPNVSA